MFKSVISTERELRDLMGEASEGSLKKETTYLTDECVRFIAELAGVPRSRVRIVKGLTSRLKVVEIEGVPQEDLERRLATISEASRK